MFQQTSAFIDALKQWNHEVGEYTTLDFRTLLFMVSYPIKVNELFADSAEEQLKELEARIKELVSTQGIDEDFLITGLIAAVTKKLEQQLTGHGESITTNEFMLEYAIENGKEGIANQVKRVLERVKDSSYYYNAENAIDKWEVILAKNFSRANRREWDGNRLSEQFRNFKVMNE